MNSRRPLLAALFALTLAACGGEPSAPPPLEGAKIGGPFTLTSQTGKRVSDQDFAGQYRLVYFGYINCPDVCPVDLRAISQGLAQFERANPDRGKKVTPLFITVDPARDTPAAMAAFARDLHPRLVALTGTPQETAAAAKAYGVYSQHGAGTDAHNYLMDHSRIAFLMSPEGKPIALVPQEQGPKPIADTLNQWVS